MYCTCKRQGLAKATLAKVTLSSLRVKTSPLVYRYREHVTLFKFLDVDIFTPSLQYNSESTSVSMSVEVNAIPQGQGEAQIFSGVGRGYKVQRLGCGDRAGHKGVYPSPPCQGVWESSSWRPGHRPRSQRFLG